MPKTKPPLKQKAARASQKQPAPAAADNWPIQELKNKLSSVLRRVATVGHQYVTKHGEPIAVLMSVEEYRALQPRRSLVESANVFREQFGGVELDIARDQSRAANRLTKLNLEA